VMVERDGREEVPSRDTLLRAGDRITAVVAASAAGGIDRLRWGVEAPRAGSNHPGAPPR